MNKAIAEVFGWIIAVAHIIAIALIALFPVEQFVGFSSIPSVWLAKGLIFLAYVAIFGSISVLISINDHLRDISAKLGGESLGAPGSTPPNRRIEPE